MKGDFSRITFRPERQFSQVLLQQGRVLLDADFNEQGAILANVSRQLARDLLGPHAGPATELGFQIAATTQGRLTIGWGRYYVDGLLATNAPLLGGGPIAAPPLFYDTQPGYPFPGSIEAANFTVDKPYFFYLDVWEQTVDWLEDGALREVALGGPDTALRSQIAWQVRAIEHVVPAAPFKPETWLEEHVQRHHWLSEITTGARMPQMKAWTDPKDNPDQTPCIADPLGGYSGLENQLYRIEIHADGSDGGPVTLKISRDNGAVVASLYDQQGNDLIVRGARNGDHAFAPGQWIELTEAAERLNRRPGIMMRLVKVHRDRLTFDAATVSRPIRPLIQLVEPLIRRWDHRESKQYQMSGGAILLEEDKAYPIERGIQISFRKAAVGLAPAYRTGDYWLVPARKAIGDIEWPAHTEVVGGGEPKKVYDFAEPHGIRHAYAPLAIIEKKSSPDHMVVTTLQRKINQLWTPV